MKAARLVLFFVAIPLVGLDDEPRTTTVQFRLQTDHVELAPAGDPPTFSAVNVPRVVNPDTGKPYDRSNAIMGCDPAHLRRTFRLESSDVLLGEPILVEFRIAVDGPGRWDEPVGSDRGLGRPGRYFFLMRHQDGEWVPDIFEGHELMALGGLHGFTRVERAEPFACWLAVQQWCAIDRPGVYDLYAFNSSGATHPAGLQQHVARFLPPEAKKRYAVDEEGRLVHPGSLELAHDRSVVLEQQGADVDDASTSPLARRIPKDVTSRFKGAAYATDYAHFTLTVRRGDARQRQAMVERWIRAANNEDVPAERTGAAETAMALARQDDFLPELKRKLRDNQAPWALGEVFLGLAMRDDPRAVDMLFEAGGSEAIEMMRFLRPSRVPAAVPQWIDRLADPDNRTRAAAEEMLRRWTGQEFGHTWQGYHDQRPTLAEGRAMQPVYRSWWERNTSRFQPRFR